MQDKDNYDLHFTFPVVAVQIVSMDPISGTVGLPDVQVPENGLDPLLCVQLAGGITLARTVTVTLATVPTGTATGMCVYIAGIQGFFFCFSPKSNFSSTRMFVYY